MSKVSISKYQVAEEVNSVSGDLVIDIWDADADLSAGCLGKDSWLDNSLVTGSPENVCWMPNQTIDNG